MSIHGSVTRLACALGCVVVLAPSVASADRGICDFDPTGARVCANPTTCVTRATCISGAGTDDNTCQTIVSNGTMASRECMPDCTTLFSCGTAADCPRVSGIAPTCSPVAAGTTTLPSVCTWSTPDASVPLAAQVTYCTPAGNHISPSQISACHRRAGMLTETTTDYFRGDCDGDGCPNGDDTNPCGADGGCAAPTPPFESPFCAPLPAIACTFTDTGLVCGDARPCNPASASILPCPGMGQCEDGWSDVPRCRPSCSSFFLCAPGSTTGGAPLPEQCPDLDGTPGACVSLPSPLTARDGRTGLCVYGDFFDASCAGMAPSAMCFHRPDDGSLTANFYAGDCDGDGAPNACDDMRCVSGGGTSDCVSVVGNACTPTYTPPPDAGVDAGTDAGVSPPDASPPDAGNVTTDTGTSSPDAGSSTNDASATIDGGVAAGFSGGGGCRCAAAGLSTRSPVGTALLLLVLGVVMRRRSRR